MTSLAIIAACVSTLTLVFVLMGIVTLSIAGLLKTRSAAARSRLSKSDVKMPALAIVYNI
jgi:hypothetical protein